MAIEKRVVDYWREGQALRAKEKKKSFGWVYFLIGLLMGMALFNVSHADQDWFSYTCKNLGNPADPKWLHPAISCGLAFTLETAGKTPALSIIPTLIVGAGKEVGDMAYYHERIDYACGDFFLLDLPGAIAGCLLSDLLFPTNEKGLPASRHK